MSTETELRGVEQEIILLLAKNPNATVYRIEKKNKLGLDGTTIKYWFKKLIEKNLIIETVQEGRRTYNLNPDTVGILNNKVILARINGSMIIIADLDTKAGRIIEDLFEGEIEILP